MVPTKNHHDPEAGGPQTVVGLAAARPGAPPGNPSVTEMLQQIVWQQQETLRMVSILLRQRRGDKVEVLLAYLRETGRVSVKEVIHRFGIARNNALKMMRRLGKQPGICFKVGNRETGSILLYNAAEALKEQHRAIAQLLNDSPEVGITLHSIITRLKCDLDEARAVANSFCLTHPGCRLEGTRIILSTEDVRT